MPARAVSAAAVLGAVLVVAGTVHLLYGLAAEGIAREALALEWRRMAAVLPPVLQGRPAQAQAIGPDRPPWLRQLFRVGEPGAPARAWVIRALTPSCYVDRVDFAIAVDAAGTVLGVAVLAHAETPGVGGRVAGPAGRAWRESFAGRALSTAQSARWALRGEGGRIDALAGATTTSACIVDGTRRALQWFAGRERAG